VNIYKVRRLEWRTGEDGKFAIGTECLACRVGDEASHAVDVGQGISEEKYPH
jgi:hypothetical protein